MDIYSNSLANSKLIARAKQLLTDTIGYRPPKQEGRPRLKKQPIGWIGPSEGKSSGTSLGKGRWRVIDSTGQWIASGFTTRAYALRWIDSFNLLQAGHQLNDDDFKWLFLHAQVGGASGHRRPPQKIRASVTHNTRGP
jgi:hypothetical protein